MASSDQIRTKLLDCIEDRISLRAFEDWFVPSTWNVHLENDSQTESLVDEIEINLSEYTDGYLTLDQLRHNLRGLVANRPFASSGETVDHINQAMHQWRGGITVTNEVWNMSAAANANTASAEYIVLWPEEASPNHPALYVCGSANNNIVIDKPSKVTGLANELQAMSGLSFLS